MILLWLFKESLTLISTGMKNSNKTKNKRQDFNYHRNKEILITLLQKRMKRTHYHSYWSKTKSRNSIPSNHLANTWEKSLALTLELDGSHNKNLRWNLTSSKRFKLVITKGTLNAVSSGLFISKMWWILCFKSLTTLLQ